MLLKIKRWVCLCSFLVMMVFSTSVFAQSEAEWGSEALDPILGLEETKYQSWSDDIYQEATYQALSKLYWVVGMHEIDNDRSVDNYLMINECDLYTKYYHNDFDWEQIRETTRDMLAREKTNFPTTFEIMLPLHLGRYNVEEEYFEINEETRFESMKKIDITLSKTHKTCFSKDSVLSGYPGSVILILNRPFTFERVPVEPELANIFLEEAREYYNGLSDRLRMVMYERFAYLRVLVRFNSYVEIVDGVGGKRRAVMHGQIDGLQVFADREKTKPLYIKDFHEIRKRRLEEISGSDYFESELDKAFDLFSDFDPDEKKDNTSLLQ